MECEVEKNEHFRHLLLYELNRGSEASEAAQNICAVYGEDYIAEKTAQKWFAHFKQSNVDMSDTALGAASGGIWRGLSIVNCLRGTGPSLLNAIVTVSPSGGSNSAKTPRSTTWSDSSA
jgi:hypothetical protein